MSSSAPVKLTTYLKLTFGSWRRVVSWHFRGVLMSSRVPRKVLIWSLVTAGKMLILRRVHFDEMLMFWLVWHEICSFFAARARKVAICWLIAPKSGFLWIQRPQCATNLSTPSIVVVLRVWKHVRARKILGFIFFPWKAAIPRSRTMLICRLERWFADSKGNYVLTRNLTCWLETWFAYPKRDVLTRKVAILRTRLDERRASQWHDCSRHWLWFCCVLGTFERK